MHQHAITGDGNLSHVPKRIDESLGTGRLAVGLKMRERHFRGVVARWLGGRVVDETDDDIVAGALAQGGIEGGRRVIAETKS